MKDKNTMIILLVIILSVICTTIFMNSNRQKSNNQSNDTKEKASINIENDSNIFKTSGDNITLDKEELEVKNIIDISAQNAFEGLSKIYKVDDNANLYSIDKVDNNLSLGSIIKKAKENEHTSDQVFLVLRRSYPVVTLEEMGLETEEEAYQATQLALWEIFSRTGESKKQSIITRIQLIKGELESKNIAVNEKVFNKADELVEFVEKYTNDELENKLDMVPTLLVDNSLVGLIEEPDREDKYLVGPYSFVLKCGYFTSSNITVKDEAGNIVNPKLVNRNGDELTDIGENTEFYLSFNELPKNTKYKLEISASFKRVVPEVYEYNGKSYVANTYTNGSVPIELTINFDSRSTVGEIELTTYDEQGNIETGRTVVLYDNEGEIGRSASGKDGKINYYNVPEGEYKLIEIDENGNEVKSKTIQVTGGEATTINL